MAIGGISTGLDFVTYHLLLEVAEPAPSKAAGYIVGTGFSILANYRWNFAYSGPNARSVILKLCALYAAALLLNVIVNTVTLAILGRSQPAILAGFVAALGVCTVFNFVGMKMLIFRPRRDLGTSA